MKRQVPLILLCMAPVFSTAALGQTIITNPSFEYGWSAWNDEDPNKDATSISGFPFTGEKSAKITRSTGQFSQQVTVYPNSDYVLHAQVRGPGIIGVELGESRFEASSEGDGDAWFLVSVPFSTNEETSLVVFGAHNRDEGRFDDFRLEAISGAALEAANEAAKGPKVYATIPGACDRMSQLSVRTAEDDGSNDGHTPDLTIDADFDPESRWSSEGAGKHLVLDMGWPQTLKEFGLAWYKGNERRSFYEISTSMDGNDFAALVDRQTSSGTTTAIERIDFDDRVARFVRITGLGNEKNEWTSIVEAQAFGCGFGEIVNQGDGSDGAKVAGVSSYGLTTNVPPAENFDLSQWKITLPVDQDGDGKADEISETKLAAGWSDEQFFYTDPVTGGMVFRTTGGRATTPNSQYQRAELREMLRAGDDSISTRNADGTPTKNNWVFSNAPEDAKAAAGAVDGTMRAKLAINQVTRVGDSAKVGRVIIGQIHAKDAEPIRLYYRKLPTNKFGSVYYIHERGDGTEEYISLVGSRGDAIDNPSDGIALDENFEYEISVSGEMLSGAMAPVLNVTLIRDDGREVVAPTLDMSNSQFSGADEFMYFKAGAYSQNSNKSWADRDFDQVTFFELSVTH